MLWAVCGKNMGGCAGYAWMEALHKEVLLMACMLRLGAFPMGFM